MMNWIPITTRLPESGVPVLVYVVNPERPKWSRRLQAQYAAKHTLEVFEYTEDEGQYDEATDSYYCPEGWYEDSEYEETHWHISDTVTHWMPLPEPPEAKP